jgi:hypothetical protein
MVTKKDLLKNQLMKEIICIRVDTLWKMLGLKKEGRLPGIEEEGATGEFDNKGAIFIPGGLIWEDVDENPITYSSYGEIGANEFRRHIRSTMQYDNATLLYPDGIASGVSLDSGFFSRAARQIFTYKKAAMKRKKKFGEKLPLEISSEDITRSHCPGYIREPYGARTRLSSCISLGLIDPAVYHAHCKTELRLDAGQKKELARSLDTAQEPIIGKDGAMLAPPYLIVCHDTRYRENILTGITRILGFGKFGEFVTFTLEEATKSLLEETKAKKEEFSPAEIFAEYEGIKVAGVLRIYSSTTPGKRSPRTTTKLVSPSKDLGLDLKQIEKEARKRYHLPTGS